jgi:predicted phosphate transport protein (TIGR00153 family)
MRRKKKGFMTFLPREEKFFALFVNQVKLIVEASRLMREAVQAGNAHMARASEEIRTLEGKGDEIIHDTFTRLNQTFITPLDPEDIHALASSLDDVLDGIEDAAHRIFAYRLQPIPPVIVQLCALICDCAASLEKCFQALNDKQQVTEHCIEINRLEDVADGVVRRAISELFDTEKDPIALIKLKEVYEFLEATTDRCEDVADVLQGVVIKNS